ncbi:ABC transporter, substrate-binding protein, family 3 domain protein [Bordetella bronchiseptica D993]|nr:ABC transporter, substrate-binding protein, family 3 domain protein [Bordetella bronchiseptica D993]KDC03256.1 ABC transporter, substrate-binding protein, family 3 domain protein [Bordetella bronchiseptica E010]KDD36333.1 ABC transporter, substrate-binding protein, family 3 domain protein [Bordetella bronchiseptica MBORD839]KFJ54887.1 bacterial extracellular solute-binding s, 3 family protein [Bordetella bronchiseptica]SUV54325.1 Glutamate/aspartate periplasmic-binding protein precursor [Bor
MKISTVFFAALVGVAASAPAHAEGRLDKIKSSGTITIGHRDASIPFSYLDDKQKPIGYSMEICEKAVEAIKAKLGMAQIKVTWCR